MVNILYLLKIPIYKIYIYTLSILLSFYESELSVQLNILLSVLAVINVFSYFELRQINDDTVLLLSNADLKLIYKFFVLFNHLFLADLSDVVNGSFKYDIKSTYLLKKS